MTSAGSPHDEGPADGGPAETGPADASPAEAGPADGGPAEAGPADATPADAGPADAGPAEAGPADASQADAGPADAGPADAGPAEAGPADAGPADGGPAEAGPADAGPADASPADAGPADASPADASPADASAADAGPADGGPAVTAPADPRRRRVRIAAVAGLAVLVAVALAVVLGTSGDRTGGASRTTVAGVELAGTTEAQALLAGIPQDGTLLGDPSAPVTIHEFADLKCPACQRYEVEAQPETITTLVRTGRANLRIHFMNVIDPGQRTTDGAGLINAAYGLAAKDRMWAFVHVLYYNQGLENREWATQARLRQIARGAPGVDPADVSVRETPTTRAMAVGDRRLARRLGVQATRTVFVEPRGTDRFGLVPDPWNGLADAVDAATRNTPRRSVAR